MTECVPEELTEIKGIGIAKACNLIAAAELGRRISSFKNIKDEPVKSPLQAAGFVMEEMRYMRHEEFWVMLLGTDGKILSIEKITVGTLNEAPVHPRGALALCARGWDVSDDAIERGVRAARWPGRFEVLDGCARGCARF